MKMANDEIILNVIAPEAMKSVVVIFGPDQKSEIRSDRIGIGNQQKFFSKSI